MLRGYCCKPRDGFALRKLAAHGGTGAVMVFAKVMLEVTETSSWICFLAAGASLWEIFGTRSEAVGLTVAKVIYAILLRQLAFILA